MLRRIALFLSVFSAIVLVAGCGGSSPSPAAPSSPSNSPAATYTLTGQVSNSLTAAPVAGAVVSIADSANAKKSATTDSSGAFTMTGLQVAGFTINVSATGFIPTSKGVNLTGNTSTSVQLTPAPVSLAGVISGQGGERVADATIQVVDGPNAGRTAYSNSTGDYRFDNLTAAAAATVAVTAGGYQSAQKSAALVGSATLSFTLVTTQPWTRSGSGDNVFNLPTYISRVRIAADYPHNSSNFVVYINGRLIVNELVGYGWGQSHFEGTYLTSGGVVEIKLSSGVAWTFTEVR
jgi:hypothetical protein